MSLPPKVQTTIQAIRVFGADELKRLKEANPFRRFEADELGTEPAASLLRARLAEWMHRAAPVGGATHFTSDFILMVKDGLAIDSFNTWLGANWLGVAYLLGTHRYKAGGVAQLAAVGGTIAQGSHFYDSLPPDIKLIVGAAVYAPQAILYSLEEPQRAWADKLKQNPSRVKRAAGQVLQFPVLNGALLGVAGGAFLVFSDLAAADAAVKGIFAAWTTGEALIGISDPRLVQLARGRPSSPTEPTTGSP